MNSARDRELPLTEHLRELRYRLTIVVLSVLLTTVVSFAFHQQLFQSLMIPVQQFSETQPGGPIFTELTEFIGVSMKLSLMGGFVLALPVVLYQGVMFISPGLNRREKVYLVILLPSSIIAFATGITFGYIILLPPALKFLMTFGSDVATPFIRIGNYISLVTTIMFWMGIAFEMPIVSFFLSRIGILDHRLLSRWRKYALILSFILGAMITPTLDPINQALVALPIAVLYEISVWVAWLARRR